MYATLLQPGDTVERCGLILKRGKTVEITNVAAEPETSFEMSPDEIFPYVKKGNIIGTWHTHPQSDPNLSGDDYYGFLCWPDLFHVIIGMRDGKVTVERFTVDNGVVMRCD